MNPDDKPRIHPLVCNGFYRIKNGAAFVIAINHAGNDDMTSVMFADNFTRIGSNPTHIRWLIEQGKFKETVKTAFKWNKSNEGKDFWIEVCRDIIDPKDKPRYVPKRRYK
jgi:hypothetical protein